MSVSVWQLSVLFNTFYFFKEKTEGKPTIKFDIWYWKTVQQNFRIRIIYWKRRRRKTKLCNILHLFLYLYVIILLFCVDDNIFNETIAYFSRLELPNLKCRPYTIFTKRFILTQTIIPMHKKHQHSRYLDTFYFW